MLSAPKLVIKSTASYFTIKLFYFISLSGHTYYEFSVIIFAWDQTLIWKKDPFKGI